MSWREGKPEPTDQLSDFPSVMTANAIAFRQGVEKHSFWTDSSGLSAGVPRLSDGSFGPGSARAFFDVASNLSSTQSSVKPLGGRLYITSDSSRLFGYNISGATFLQGGTRSIVFLGSSQATPPTDSYQLTQIGNFQGSASIFTVAFPTAYSSAPAIQLTPIASTGANITLAQLVNSSATNFAAVIRNVFGGVTSASTVLWRSYGTAPLSVWS